MINEQDVKELASKLEEVKGESSKILDKVLSEDYVADDSVKIVHRGSELPSSGLTILEDAPAVTNDATKNYNDAVEELAQLGELKSLITDEEATQLFKIVTESQNNPDYDVYANMPPRMKTQITNVIKIGNIKGKAAINSFCRMMIDTFITEIKLDENISEYMNDLNAVLAIPDPIDMYNDHTRETFEVNILKQADSLTNKTEADKIRLVSKAYTDSYTLERQKAILTSEFYNKLNKNINKYFKRLCDNFDFKLYKAGYKNKSIFTLIDKLQSLFKINETIAKKYIVALCLTTKDYQISNKDEIWFMYSSIRNIESLAAITKNHSEFSQLMINNIKSFIEEMLDKENKESEV